MANSVSFRECSQAGKLRWMLKIIVVLGHMISEKTIGINKQITFLYLAYVNVCYTFVLPMSLLVPCATMVLNAKLVRTYHATATSIHFGAQIGVVISQCVT